MWSLVDVIRLKFGAHGLHAIRTRLSSERREQFRTLPGQSAWFDYGLYLDVLRSATERFYAGDPRGAFDLSRLARQLDAKRVFSELGIFETPRTFISQIRALRSHYFDGGDADGALVAPSLLRFKLSGLPAPCEVAANDLAGGVAGMLEMSGAREVRLHELHSTSVSCTAFLGFEERAPQGVM